MELEKFKEKLKRYREEDIVFTSHAEIRALFRNMDLDEILPELIKYDDKDELEANII